MKVKALRFTKIHGFHGNKFFSRKKANFTENVTAVKSWIRLVPSHSIRHARIASHSKNYSISCLAIPRHYMHTPLKPRQHGALQILYAAIQNMPSTEYETQPMQHTCTRVGSHWWPRLDGSLLSRARRHSSAAQQLLSPTRHRQHSAAQ